jgi:hypothetical protein
VDHEFDSSVLTKGVDAPFHDLVSSRSVGSMTLDDFMRAIEREIPQEVKDQIDVVLKNAKEQADLGLAAPFPDSDAERERLWHTLACSWLHSRDVEVSMGAIGYPLLALGVHDVVEYVPVEDLVRGIKRSQTAGQEYSPWFRRWIDSLQGCDTVNVGFFNPNLAVSAWRWKPDRDMPQDAMDAHRLSSHHEGDDADRYDAVEASVNNVLHAREGVYGVQKEPVVQWEQFELIMKTRSSREELAKSVWGASLVGDVATQLRYLEAKGYVVPWGLVNA